MHHAKTSTAPALLCLHDVVILVGRSKSTLYRWAQAGMFPRPYALTPTRSSVAWSAAEVYAWIAAKLSAPEVQDAMNDGTFVGTSPKHAAQAA
jgi:prophage regulatory protein